MKKEMFRGKPVLYCVNECDKFYADLFCMLADIIGGESIIETDDICRHHFNAFLGRLRKVCYHDEPSADIDDVLVLYLGKPLDPADS